MKSRIILFMMLLLGVATQFTYAGDKPIPDGNPSLKIVGGEDCDIEEYPWQVAIFGIDEMGNITEQMCGGSIIDQYWVLTAAHCIMAKSNKTQKIVCEITKLSEADNGQIIEIADFIVHENYNTVDLTNDIALLRLSQPIDTSRNGSKIIRVMTPAEELDGLLDPGTLATITGWGTTEYMGDSPDNLQVASFPIISIETANQWFEETNSEASTVTEGMLPAGLEEGGISGCHGDSGGPLVVKDNDGNWVLAGITSWGNICGGPKQPAVYTRVPYYYNWIMENSGINIVETPTEPDYVEAVKLDIPAKVFVCDDVANFGELMIRNFGTNDLSIFELTVKVGKSEEEILASESRMVVLTEPLKPLAAKRIDITPVLPDTLGTYYIEITVGKPNLQDVSIVNNKLASTINYVDPSPLKIKFEFTKAGGELNWVIFELPSFTEFASNTINPTNAGETNIQNICLPDGTYAFSMNNEDTDFKYTLSFDYEGEEFVVATGDQSDMAWSTFSVPFVPINNVSLNLNSKITSDSIFICSINDLNIIPNLEVRNAGSIIAKDVKVRTTINNIIKDTIFTRPISAGGVGYLSIDPTGFQLGANSFLVEVLDFNDGAEDVSPEDNSLDLSFDLLIQPQIANITVTPDMNYYFYSFSIENLDGEVVYNHSFNQPIEYNLSACLPEGCYIFKPESWMNSPINSDTALTIRSMDGSVALAIKGNEYIESNEFPFCLSYTGINDDVVTGLQAFPNPASKFLLLNVPASTNVSAMIDISDMLGNRIASWNYTLNSGTNHLNLDVSNISTGIYNLRIIAGNDIETKRVVIQK